MPIKQLSPLLARKLWALGAVIPFLAAIGAWQGAVYVRKQMRFGYITDDVRNISLAVRSYYAEHEVYPEDLEVLIKQGLINQRMLHQYEGATLKYRCPAVDAPNNTIILEATYLQFRMTVDKAFNRVSTSKQTNAISP